MIDATEWVGPWNDLAFGFYKITKNYYGPGFHEPGTASELLLNKAAWDGLEPDLQAIVEDAAAATNVRMLAEFTAANNESQRVLIEEHGVQLRPFPKDVFDEMLVHSDDVVRATAQGRRSGAADLRELGAVPERSARPQSVRRTGVPPAARMNHPAR